MTNLPHIASRIFGTPLMIQPTKLDAILAALGPRLGLPSFSHVPAPQALIEPAEKQDRKPYTVTGDGIAVISILGPLIQRGSMMDALCGMTTYSQIESEFMDAMNDSAITGVLFDCDSAGGESAGCFDLANLIASLRGKKPMVAVSNSTMLSACFALGSAADRVVINQNGCVGSVGTIIRFVDQTGLDQQMGLKYEQVSFGDRKNDMDPHSPLSAEARAFAQSEVDRVGAMFVGLIARNRDMRENAVRDTQAAYYFGENAVSIGFADQVGTIDDGLSLLGGMIAKPSSKISIPAASAVGSSQNKGGKLLPETLNPADAVEALPEKLTPEAIKKMKAKAEAKGYARALDIASLCEVGGLSAGDVGEFLRANASPEDVRAKLMRVRASADANTTSHITPASGTGDARAIPLAENPLVLSAKSRAEAAKGKGGIV